MTNRLFDTILIDYDGTLMDTNELVLESWLYAIKKLTGKDGDPAEVRRYFGEVIVETMPKLIPGVPAELAIATYREYQIDNYLPRIRPFPGAKEVLAELKKRGCLLGLPTSRLRPTTMQGLEHFELAQYFDAILTAGETEKFKPDPEPIFKIIEMLGSTPERTIMLGDTKHDLEAAGRAGVASVLVDWSVALPAEPPEKRAAAPKPDFVVKDWGEVLTKLPIKNA